jgi:aldehyde dehydrogenase (NAD+)
MLKFAASTRARVSESAGEHINSTLGLGSQLSTREIDIPDAIGCLRYYAGLADKFFGQTINHFGQEKFVYTLHVPIGVCGQM